MSIEKSIVAGLSFEGVGIDIQFDEKGEPLWCAPQVCSILGYADAAQAVRDHVDPDDTSKRRAVNSRGLPYSTNWINESGLYSLIMGSKLPKAKAFARWVTKEVLPSIRKTGSYSAHQGEFQDLALRYPDVDLESLSPNLLRTAQAMLRLGQVASEPEEWSLVYSIDFRKMIWELDGQKWNDDVQSPAGMLPFVYESVYKELFGQEGLDALRALRAGGRKLHQALTEDAKCRLKQAQNELMYMGAIAQSVPHLIEAWKEQRARAAGLLVRKTPVQMSLVARIGGAMKLLAGRAP